MSLPVAEVVPSSHGGVAPRIVPAIPLTFGRIPAKRMSLPLEPDRDLLSSISDRGSKINGNHELGQEEGRASAELTEPGGLKSPVAPSSNTEVGTIEEKADAEEVCSQRSSPIPPQFSEPDVHGAEDVEVFAGTGSKVGDPPPETLHNPQADQDEPNTDLVRTIAAPVIIEGLPHSSFTWRRLSAAGLVFGGQSDSPSISPAPLLPSSRAELHIPAFQPGLVSSSFGPPPISSVGHNVHFAEPLRHMVHPQPGLYGPEFFVPPPPTFSPTAPYFGPPPPMLPHENLSFYRLGVADLGSTVKLPSNPNGDAKVSQPQPRASSLAHDKDASSRMSEIYTGSKSIPNLESPERVMGLPMEPAEAVYRPRNANAVVSHAAAKHTPSAVSSKPSASELVAYLSSQAGNWELADYILDIFSSLEESQRQQIAAHGIILGQSPTLLSLIRTRPKDAVWQSMRPRVLEIRLTDRFLTVGGFKEALNDLYGRPLTLDDVGPGGLSDGQSFSGKRGMTGASSEQYRHILAYLSAGYFLEVPRITERGFELAAHHLSWENVKDALAFALEDSLGPPLQTNHSPTDVPVLLERSQRHHRARLLQNIVQFLAYNFPRDFAVDEHAPQLTEAPRFPLMTESRPSISDPRLGDIRFGDMSPDIALTKPAVRVLSSVLLSVPFDVLRAVLEHYALGGRLGWPKLVEVMHEVVEEREYRRSTAAKSRNRVAHLSRPHDPLWHNTYWMEMVEPSKNHGSGFVLAQRWKGPDRSAHGVDKA